MRESHSEKNPGRKYYVDKASKDFCGWVDEGPPRKPKRKRPSHIEGIEIRVSGPTSKNPNREYYVHVESNDFRGWVDEGEPRQESGEPGAKQRRITPTPMVSATRMLVVEEQINKCLARLDALEARVLSTMNGSSSHGGETGSPLPIAIPSAREAAALGR